MQCQPPGKGANVDKSLQPWAPHGWQKLSWGWDLGDVCGIWVMSMGFGSCPWDLGDVPGIWVMSLGFWWCPWDSGGVHGLRCQQDR